VKRLYTAISHHGLGHLAQTAPVLQCLYQQVDGIEFVVRSALPKAALDRRLPFSFRHLEQASDCNFVMHDALRIDEAASLADYRAFHADWERRVSHEAETLTALRVDAVLSNVGYLSLAAAQRAGVPSIGLCSLNWADIFSHYLGNESGAAAMHAEMVAAYRGATLFLRPEPSMPMPDLVNAVRVPPIAHRGQNRRAEIDRRLELSPRDRLVLVGMGGIPYRPPVEQWPRRPDIVWLVPDAWGIQREDFRTLSAAGLPFADLLASADALLTKPGYGSFVEAVTAGVPVLYLPRPDWPETPWLTNWLEEKGRALMIDEALLQTGDLLEPLQALWALGEKAALQAEGASASARLIAHMLD
jgi:hypothetical protein